MAYKYSFVTIYAMQINETPSLSPLSLSPSGSFAPSPLCLHHSLALPVGNQLLGKPSRLIGSVISGYQLQQTPFTAPSPSLSLSLYSYIIPIL